MTLAPAPSSLLPPPSLFLLPPHSPSPIWAPQQALRRAVAKHPSCRGYRARRGRRKRHGGDTERPRPPLPYSPPAIAPPIFQILWAVEWNLHFFFSSHVRLGRRGVDSRHRQSADPPAHSTTSSLLPLRPFWRPLKRQIHHHRTLRTPLAAGCSTLCSQLPCGRGCQDMFKAQEAEGGRPSGGEGMRAANYVIRLIMGARV